MKFISEPVLPLVNLGMLPELSDAEISSRIGGLDSVVVDVSSIAAGEISDRDILKQSLRNIRKRQAFEQIVFEYPTLNEAALNLCIYFAWIFPAADGSVLLERCLKNAIESFNSAHWTTSIQFDEMAKMRGFITGAAQYFNETLFVQVYGRTLSGWRMWEPLSEPIYDWISKYGYNQVLVVPTSENYGVAQYNVVRNKLLHSIFEFRDLNMTGVG